MKRYRKAGGESGVTAYETADDKIIVVFDDMVYEYTYKKPGPQHVEAMKKYAEAGEGLSTYISQNVKTEYETKYPLTDKSHDRNTE